MADPLTIVGVVLGVVSTTVALATRLWPSTPPAPAPTPAPQRETIAPQAPAPLATCPGCAALSGRVGAVEVHMERVDAAVGAAAIQLTRIETLQQERLRAQEARRAARESS